MKRIYIFTLLLMTSIVILAQDYYWYQNHKIFLQKGDERYVLFNADSKSKIDSSAYIKIKPASDSSLIWGIQKQNMPISPEVIYTTPSYFIQSDSTNIYLTERFYVKLKQPEDYEMLVRYAEEHDVKIVEEESFHLWYVLLCTERCKMNALNMANLFYESGLFAAAEPEFINGIRFACVDDTYFGQQWNLLNTGQQNMNYIGVDINFCDAYAITSGVDSVWIAIVDDGIASHFDVSYLYSYSIDAVSESYPAQVYGSHGTQCAGIVAAHANNNHGVAGIAPDCRLLSVSFDIDTYPSQIASGIEFVVDQGASILSNSWISYVPSYRLNEAIDYALTEGRNGKGCVVAFAAGNGNSCHLAYPANSNPDIIAVGAMTPSATRASYPSWGSNYGSGLDVVAPGVEIPTTIPSSFPYQFQGDFTTNFEGTSAACPHVAAIAGLVLSVNPDLTQKDVAAIIESTAQKVGNYSYDSIASHGSWNNEMGYGLVDAKAAVLAALTVHDLQEIEIEGPVYLCDSSYYYALNAPQGTTFQWAVSPTNVGTYTISILGQNNRDSVLLGVGFNIREEDDDNRGGILPPFPPGPAMDDTTTMLSVTATYAGVSYYTATKKLYSNVLGTPKVNVSDTSSTWLWRTSRTFTVSNCTEVPNDSLKWTVKRRLNAGSSMATVYSTIGRSMTYTPRFAGPYEITVTNSAKQCGTNSKTMNYTVNNLILLNGEEGEDSQEKVEERNETPASKILKDGEIYIRKDEKMYKGDGRILHGF